MIIFNNELVLQNYEQLQEFCTILTGEIFNETSGAGVEQIIAYLYDCFEANLELEQLILERVADDLLPVVYINYEEDYNTINQINFGVFSLNENRELTQRENILFEELCNLCFKDVRSLLDRIASVS